eukprot:scaffold2460_cov109-Isochrysis_galbana.AAC.9
MMGRGFGRGGGLYKDGRAWSVGHCTLPVRYFPRTFPVPLPAGSPTKPGGELVVRELHGCRGCPPVLCGAIVPGGGLPGARPQGASGRRRGQTRAVVHPHLK